MLLHLPDGAEGLAGDPADAIRLANAHRWESSTGYNLLGKTITVGADAVASGCDATLPLESGI